MKVFWLQVLEELKYVTLVKLTVWFGWILVGVIGGGIASLFF